MNPEPAKHRVSVRRLPGELQKLNLCIKEKIRHLRHSIYVQSDKSRSERRSAQRNVLARILGLPTNYVSSLETGKDAVPAAILLILLERYKLSPRYFVSLDEPLSPVFLAEQRLQEMSDTIKTVKSAFLRRAAGASEDTLTIDEASFMRKRGGWLKGLPRHPKTQQQIAIYNVWQAAREAHYPAHDLEDLLRWGTEQNIPGASEIKLSLASGLHDSVGQETILDANLRLPVIASKRGGWLKGVPRSPKNDHEAMVLQAWNETRRLGLQFTSIDELLAWWKDHSASA